MNEVSIVWLRMGKEVKFVVKKVGLIGVGVSSDPVSTRMTHTIMSYCTQLITLFGYRQENMTISQKFHWVVCDGNGITPKGKI